MTNTLPVLEIYRRGGANIGRCYNAQYFEIRCSHELSNEKIHKLREAGFLGYGQEFYINPSAKEDGFFVYKVESRVDSSD